MQLSISDQEKAVLAEVLEQTYRNLKEEIYKTDAQDFKEGLKLREETLEGLLGKLGLSVEAL